MTPEQEVFSRKSADLRALVPYGFEKADGGYRYSESFMDGEFRAEVFIDSAGSVTGKVIDIASDEEYIPVRIESRTGPFVEEVRSAYKEVLSKIAEKCFRDELFIFEQSNRLTRLIEQKYGERPDFPFEKLPTYGVFRYPDNRKWYGLIMNIRRSLLKGGKDIPPEDDEIIEILNAKVGEENAKKLTETDGIYPSYHMNRKNWITVLLNGTVSDRQIMEIIDISRTMAVRSGGAIKSEKPLSRWIIPANPKYFDIKSAFQRSPEINWKQSSDIRVGDIVYMYVAAPVSAVKYKCEVLETKIPYKSVNEHINIKFLMRIRLIEEYPDGLCTFSKLKELGINAVRGPRSVTGRFLEYIDPDALK